MNKKLLLGLIAVITLGSCTIQKRQYMGGYHVEWHKPIAKKIQKTEISKEQSIAEVSIKENKNNIINTSTKVNEDAIAFNEHKTIINVEKNSAIEKVNENFLSKQNFDTQSHITITHINKSDNIKEIRKEIRKTIRNELKKEKKVSGSLHPHLRMAILLFAIGLVVWIMGFFLWPLFFVSYLLFLASAIFFILWIVEEL